MNSHNDAALEKDVVGTTFEVYLHLLKTKHASEREVYHDLQMSSPYLATYHLNKLLELKLAHKDQSGVYHVNAKRFGVLHFFEVTGKWLIPRTLFYAVFQFAMAFSFLIVLPVAWNLLVFVLMLISAFINVFETALFYRALTNHSGNGQKKRRTKPG
jgi:hypothetical protein